MKEVPQVVAVTGPPGAGKTSVAEALVARLDGGVLVDGDAFFQSIRNGWIPPWQPEAHRQNETVIQAIGAAAAQFAAGGYRVVVDGVIWPWFLEVFLDQLDVPVGYVVLRPSAEQAMGGGPGRRSLLTLNRSHLYTTRSPVLVIMSGSSSTQPVRT